MEWSTEEGKSGTTIKDENGCCCFFTFLLQLETFYALKSSRLFCLDCVSPNIGWSFFWSLTCITSRSSALISALLHSGVGQNNNLTLSLLLKVLVTHISIKSVQAAVCLLCTESQSLVSQRHLQTQLISVSSLYVNLRLLIFLPPCYFFCAHLWPYCLSYNAAALWNLCFDKSFTKTHITMINCLYVVLNYIRHLTQNI